MKTDKANVERLRSSVAYIMTLSDEQVRAIAPTASGGIYFTDCPNCEFGAEEAECFNKTWDPRQPRRLVCKGCGAVYPNNPTYPDDAFIEVDAPGGKKHRFHYWQRKDGYRVWFRAHADYWAREWLQDQCRDLGDLYAATGDERFARRAAVILVRFAEVYPGWPTIFDYPFRQKVFSPYTTHRIPGIRGYRNSRWTWWGYMDIPLDLVQAYDSVKAWPGLKRMAGGRAVRMIEHDLFDGIVGFVLGIEEDYTNMSMGMWRSGIYAGRVLGRPDWVHDCVRRFEHLVETRFLYDGHWQETSDSYAAQTDGGMRVVMSAAAGYSDPAGYKDPTDGRRFDNLNLRRIVPGFDAAARAVGDVRLPDNRLLPVNDTWAAHGKTSRWWRQSSRKRMQPVLLPGSGVAVLGGGRDEHQLHAYLNYTMGVHHKHYDALSIGLFAHGKELFPDIGYTWTHYRLHWPTSTMAHNTVVVNGENSRRDREHTGHRLRNFVTDGKGFHLASVDATDTAYPGVASRYRRTLAVVGADSRDAYLVDLFEVRGGRQHDYLLLGSVDEDSTARVTGASLAPFAGTLVNPDVTFRKPEHMRSPNPNGHGFGFYTDLKAAPVKGDTVTLDLRLDAAPNIGTRTILSPGPRTTLYLARVPSIRRAREVNGHLDRDQAPAFCVRRQGKSLSSTFAAVHEPVNGRPRLEGLTVTRRPNAVLLCVDRGEQGRDYFVHARDGRAKAAFDTPDGRLTLDGRSALVRLDRAGQVAEAHLVGGARVSLGRFVLEGEPGWAGAVRAVGRQAGKDHRGWFDVAEAVAPGRHGTLIVHFADKTIRPFNIVRIEPTNAGSRLYVREAPAFEVAKDMVKLVSYPQRQIKGARLHYTLAGVARHRP